MLAIACCDRPHDQAGLDSYFDGSMMKMNRGLTDIIVSDIFTPPVASRIYAYPNIAAYEAARHMDPGRPTLAGQLNGLQTLPLPEAGKEHYFPLASLVAFTRVAQSLVYDLEKMQELREQWLEASREIGIDKETYQNSIEFGNKIATAVLEWAGKDGYHRRTALPRYSVKDDPGRWRPTPPDYMEAIEPHWATIRPFVMDSSGQFDPGPPTPFDTLETSSFYREAREVYETVRELGPEEMAIAKFWDCNPNISHTRGHVMFFQQQISPGGHWMHIGAQVLEEQDLDQAGDAALLAELSIALADAFISCWDQKYKSGLTRPETYINTFIDPEWTPVLQTPAFPEHTSGHSVASAAAATILTARLGDQYHFIDSTEVPYGLPPRTYNSFMEAAREAAISRLYGGIHYRPAVEKGVRQGIAVGRHILESIHISPSALSGTQQP